MSDPPPRDLEPLLPVSSELLRRRARSSGCDERPRAGVPAEGSARPSSPSRPATSAAREHQESGAHRDELDRTADRCLGGASIRDGAP